METLQSDLLSSRISLDKIVDNFTQLLKSIIIGGKSRVFVYKRFPRNSWFDKDCKNIKRIVNTMASLYKMNANNNMAKRNYFNQRKIYKSIIKKKNEQIQSYSMLSF